MPLPCGKACGRQPRIPVPKGVLLTSAEWKNGAGVHIEFYARKTRCNHGVDADFGLEHLSCLTHFIVIKFNVGMPLLQKWNPLILLLSMQSKPTRITLCYKFRTVNYMAWSRRMRMCKIIVCERTMMSIEETDEH
jgi:hypothetical protein